MEILFEIIGTLISGLLDSLFEDRSLNTKKIDRHIERLKQYTWFKVLYEDERYHEKFFVNRHIRRYLQSRVSVRRMIKYEKSRKKLITLLNKQIQSNR